jgi:hypothetical protein
MVMKRDNIQDFIAAWKSWDKTNAQNLIIPIWHNRFREAGYYECKLGNASKWTDSHQWCKENIGEQHYAWVGNVFWFETEQDAIAFTLKWT